MISEIDIKDWIRVNEPKIKRVKNSMKLSVFPYTYQYANCYNELKSIHDSLLALQNKANGQVAALFQPVKKDG